MKNFFTKLLMIVFASVFSLTTHAQKTRPTTPLKKQVVKTSAISSNAQRATTLFSSDFTTVSSWTIVNTNALVPWVIGSAATQTTNPFPRIATTGNYAAIDSDTPGAAAGAYSSDLRTTNSFSCVGQSAVYVTFDQFYTKYADITKIIVSTNGTVWNQVAIPQNDAYLQNDQGPNPETIAVNITALAAGQPTVWVGFRISGNYDWVWMVDNVSVIGLPQYDLVANEIFPLQKGSVGGYSRVPKSQVDSIAFFGKYTNAGSATQNNVTFTHAIPTTTYTKTSTITTFTGLFTTDTLTAIQFFSQGFITTLTGTYTVNSSITSANTDAFPADNTVAMSFAVTDTVFAREALGSNSQLFGVRTTGGAAFRSTFPYIIGNKYQIKNAAKANSISFAVSNVTSLSVAGAKLRVSLKYWNGTAWVNQGTPATYTLTNADRPTSNAPVDKFVTVKFPTPISLTANTEYLACVEKFITTTADSTLRAFILATDNVMNSNKLMNDENATLIFGYANASATPDPLPFTLGDIQAMIRLNVVDCNSITASSASVTGTTCNQNNGSINVTGSSWYPPYSYSFTPASGTNANATGLTAGVYSYTVTDAAGCTVTRPVTLTNSGTASTISIAPTASTCGLANGSATASLTSGPAISSYSWSTSPVQTSATATGLTAGVYTLTVTNTGSCSTTSTTTITNSGAASTISTSSTNPTCGLANGTASASFVSGPTISSYSWNSSPVQNTANATGLVAGVYTVTATNVNSCPTTRTVTLTNSGTPSTLSLSSSNPTCNQSNGTATASLASGPAISSYSWNSSPVQNVAGATGLLPGVYTVTAINSASCTTTGTVTLTNNGTSSTLTTSSSPTSICGGTNGTASVSLSSGPALTSFAWATIPVQTSATATGLSAGNYNVNVTNANGCTTPATVSVADGGAPTLTATVISTVSCFGGTNGSVSVSISPATPGYSYSFNGGVYTTNTTFTGVAAGPFTINGTNGSCNIATAGNVAGPSQIAGASATASTVDCASAANGTILITGVTGGVSPYNYSWTGAATGSNATGSLTGLAAGTYNIVIKDANNCTMSPALSAQSVNVVTPGLSGSVTTPITCFGGNNGSVTLSFTGATGTGYQYSFNGGPLSSSMVYSSVAAGTFAISASNGTCTIPSSVVVNEPAVIATTSSVTQPTCNASNGAISILSTSGGSGALSGVWTNPSSLGTALNVTSLAAGSYTYTVTDANSCSKNFTFVLTNSGTPSVISVSGTNASGCAATDGSATASVTSGAAATGFVWSTSPAQNAATATGLTAGQSYSVTVTNTDGCQTTGNVSIGAPGVPSMNVSSTNVLCNAAATGSVSVSLTPAAPTYQFSFNGGALTASTSFTGLTAGTYTISATDGACTINANAIITQPNALTGATTSITTITCKGNSTGAISVTGLSGGVAPYTYSWAGPSSGNNATGSITGLSAGNYTVTLKDANNCTLSPALPTQVVSEPSTGISFGAVTAVDQSVGSPANGQIQVIATGATSISSSPGAIWSQSGTTFTASNLVAGTYSITANDLGGCSLTTTAVVGSTVGIEDRTIVNTVSVYPNPTDNNFTISFTSSEVKNVTVKLINLNGQDIFTQELPQFIGEYVKTINMTNQAQGVYFIQITSEKDITTKKVVKL